MESFVIVMLFFSASTFSVSWMLQNQLASSTAFQTFQMAFAGDFVPLLFLPCDPNGDVGNEDWDTCNKSDERGVQWIGQFILHCFFGIIVVVALNNIFIGMLGNTYDNFQKRAEALFVKRRATVALDWALTWGTYDKDGFLWFCSPTRRAHLQEEDLDDQWQQDTEKAIAKLDEKVDRVLGRMDELMALVSPSVASWDAEEQVVIHSARPREDRANTAQSSASAQREYAVDGIGRSPNGSSAGGR